MAPAPVATAVALVLGAGLLAAAPRLSARTQVSAARSSGEESGWHRLFDGRTLNGWKATGNKAAGWAVEEGAIACLANGGGYLYTTEPFQDFVLRGEFKVNPRVNSGIFLRWSDLRDPVNTGIEIQVLDSFGRVKPERHDCGAIYDILAPSFDATRPAGEWNPIEITADGPILRVVLNDQQIAEADLREWTTPHQNPDGSRNKFQYAYNTMTHPGHIGLQDHGGRCWYRNLQIKSLRPWSPPVHG